MSGPSTRRQFLMAGAGSVAVAMLPLSALAMEEVEAMHRQLALSFPDEPIEFDERVQLSLPALAENGNSVDCAVSVDSAMTDAEHVVSIDVLAPENPNPQVLRLLLSPASGRAAARTRIRLGGSQSVVAVARLSDGSLIAGAAGIVVTEAACLDFLI